jgi:transposase, IS5 family
MGGLPIGGQRSVHKKERLRHHVHRKKPKGRARRDPARQQRQIENPLQGRACLREQKGRMDLFIRTIGSARATVKIGLANLVYNLDCCS